MDTFCGRSTLETLPDEILLEVCKYLLCSDVLYSFMALNSRLTRMIAQYRHRFSFHRTSVSIFDYLCVNVLPQIGQQIRSLVIDCHYSVLQDRSFLEHFTGKMSTIFPNLERVNLTSYEHDGLVAFLHILGDLDHLVEIRLHGLFPLQTFQQPALAQLLMQANNHRLTTVLVDDVSSTLSFDENDRYSNILQLRINIDKKADLFSLFAVVPNVQRLDVTISEGNGFTKENNETLRFPLHQLTNFQLKSVEHSWTLDEIMALIAQLPVLQYLSLNLRTRDERLVKGDVVLALLPSTIQQFSYVIVCFSDITSYNKIDTVVSSWPPSHSVACFFNNNFLFLHTLPWCSSCLVFPPMVGEITPWQTIHTNGYDQHVEQLHLFISEHFSSAKSLKVLSQCRRVRRVTICTTANNDISINEEPLLPCIPTLSRALEIRIRGSIPSDRNYFLIIFNAAPSLSVLDLPFGHLLKLIEEPRICSILNQRITTLNIRNNEFRSPSKKLNELHIPIIASALPRVRDLYVNIMHILSSKSRISIGEDIFQGSFIQNVFAEFDEEKEDERVIFPSTTESMLLCLLTTFKEHKLAALCVDGYFLEKLESDPEKWLQANTHLCEQQFRAAHRRERNRLLIWM